MTNADRITGQDIEATPDQLDSLNLKLRQMNESVIQAKYLNSCARQRQFDSNKAYVLRMFQSEK